MEADLMAGGLQQACEEKPTNQSDKTENEKSKRPNEFGILFLFYWRPLRGLFIFVYIFFLLQSVTVDTTGREFLPP